jgi:hypothetical protein
VTVRCFREPCRQLIRVAHHGRAAVAATTIAGTNTGVVIANSTHRDHWSGQVWASGSTRRALRAVASVVTWAKGTGLTWDPVSALSGDALERTQEWLGLERESTKGPTHAVRIDRSVRP